MNIRQVTVLWYVNIDILFWSGKTENGSGKCQGILKSDANGNPVKQVFQGVKSFQSPKDIYTF